MGQSLCGEDFALLSGLQVSGNQTANNQTASKKGQVYFSQWPDGANLPTMRSPLSVNDLRKRIEFVPTADLPIGQLTGKLCCISQRGYYPDSPTKANQDAFVIRRNLECGGKISGAVHFIAVYDGHGPVGEKASQYAQKWVPKLLSDKLSQGKEIRVALKEAHIECDANLAADGAIDHSQSGTTAVAMLFVDSKVYVSNVGDSRVMVGEMLDGKLQARALTQDQTPYRKDERERVKKSGARVLRYEQVLGNAPKGPGYEDYDVALGDEIDESDDPPRIWHPTEIFPGAAFTRSIGDGFASDLGVFAEPEVEEYNITADTQYLVIASDGVFEFINTRSVIDITAMYADPADACRALTGEAYRLWLKRMGRTDDITCAVLSLADKPATFGTSDGLKVIEEVDDEHSPGAAAARRQHRGSIRFEGEEPK